VTADIEDVGQPASQALLYRAARELLANVNKHAHATEVTVGLHCKGDRIVLVVADDGAGFNPAMVTTSVANGHIGLASLQVRVEANGGTMQFDTGPGAGTRVTVTL
jgi:two-component system, NarL family, sensor kinase